MKKTWRQVRAKPASRCFCTRCRKTTSAKTSTKPHAHRNRRSARGFVLSNFPSELPRVTERFVVGRRRTENHAAADCATDVACERHSRRRSIINAGHAVCGRELIIRHISRTAAHARRSDRRYDCNPQRADKIGHCNLLGSPALSALVLDPYMFTTDRASVLFLRSRQK